MAELNFDIISPSLLDSITIRPVSAQFSLGMEEWTDSYLQYLAESTASLANSHGDQQVTPPTS